jgi:hypothetical protein
MKTFNSITAQELAKKYNILAKDIPTKGNRDENKITIKNVKEYIQLIKNSQTQIIKTKDVKSPTEIIKTKDINPQVLIKQIKQKDVYNKLNKYNKKKLIDCITKYKSKKCSIDESYDSASLPIDIFDFVDIIGDGACQLRAIAYNILSYKNQKTSNLNQKKIAETLYKFIKYIIIKILPKLTIDQLINDWGFIHFDRNISVLENLNNEISYYHNESEINSLQDYYNKFKYGIYTTQLELFILMNKNNMIQKWWIDNFNFIPSIIVYIINKKNLNEIGSFNIELLVDESVPIFRLVYVSRIHYEVLQLKEECKSLKNKLRLNTIMNFFY